VFRIIAFAFLCFFVFYISINTGLALIYAYFLTHPSCIDSPKPLPGFPPAEEYWLQTSDGLQLRAWYYPPQNGIVIITLGGQRGSLGQNLPPVTALIQSGYGVLQMDSRACAKPPSVVTLGAEEINDVNAGVAFLSSQSGVNRVGAFGYSMGAAAVIRAAANNPDIDAVIAEGGFYNLGDDIIEPDQDKSLPLSIFLYTLAGSYWMFSGVNPWQVSPIDDLPRISPRPVFLVYGENEAASGRAEAQYAAAYQPKTIWITPGGDHGTNHLAAPQVYQDKILSYFDRTLLQE
jgi:pimeloyl-ACP methyl ester carboxylesterase